MPLAQALAAVRSELDEPSHTWPLVRVVLLLDSPDTHALISRIQAPLRALGEQNGVALESVAGDASLMRAVA